MVLAVRGRVRLSASLQVDGRESSDRALDPGRLSSPTPRGGRGVVERARAAGLRREDPVRAPGGCGIGRRTHGAAFARHHGLGGSTERAGPARSLNVRRELLPLEDGRARESLAALRTAAHGESMGAAVPPELRLVLAITVLVLALRRRVPGLPAAWVTYIVVLLPVLGIFQSGSQIAADRYTYLAGLGWAILAGAGLLSCWHATRFLIRGSAVGVLVGLGVLTWNQVHVWHDSEKLWTHALAIDPKSSVAHSNLGSALIAQGKPAEASEHFREALRINPNDADDHTNLGMALAWQGKLVEASEHYQQALRIKPTSADAHNNWGTLLARQGKLA